MFIGTASAIRTVTLLKSFAYWAVRILAKAIFACEKVAEAKVDGRRTGWREDLVDGRGCHSDSWRGGRCPVKLDGHGRESMKACVIDEEK